MVSNLKRPQRHPLKALVFGHADGDGYAAAEQSRANLTNIGFEALRVIVDPLITPNHSFWHTAFSKWDFDGVDLVVVVDIMLRRRNPLQSFRALMETTSRQPSTRFVIIDHHPVEDLPTPPANTEIRFVREVYNCCYGKPSDLMVVAAICDHDEGPVAERITPILRKRALGLTLATANRARFSSQVLIDRLRERDWDFFERLVKR